LAVFLYYSPLPLTIFARVYFARKEYIQV